MFDTLFFFTQYVQEKLGIDIGSLTLAIVNKLSLIIIGIGKVFMLSFDSEEAKEQLEKIGYHSKQKKK